MASCSTDDDTARTCAMTDPSTFARAQAGAAGYSAAVARLILHGALGHPPPAEGTA